MKLFSAKCPFFFSLTFLFILCSFVFLHILFFFFLCTSSVVPHFSSLDFFPLFFFCKYLNHECVCVFSFGSGFFCPSLLSCMLWFCVGRAHWYLVVVCFPGLEEARYEEFQRRAGELTWFLSLWLNESCGFGHVQQSVSNGHQTYWCLRPSGRQRFRVFGAQCSPALIKTPCSKLTPKIKGLNVPDLNMFSTKDPFRHF